MMIRTLANSVVAVALAGAAFAETLWERNARLDQELVHRLETGPFEGFFNGLGEKLKRADRVFGDRIDNGIGLCRISGKVHLSRKTLDETAPEARPRGRFSGYSEDCAAKLVARIEWCESQGLRGCSAHSSAWKSDTENALTEWRLFRATIVTPWKIEEEEAAIAAASSKATTIVELEMEADRLKAELAALQERRALAEQNATLAAEVEAAKRAGVAAEATSKPNITTSPRESQVQPPAIAVERVEIPGSTAQDRANNSANVCVRFVKEDARYGFKEGWGAEYSQPNPGVNRLTWKQAQIKNEFGTWMKAPLACDTVATPDGRLFLTKITLGGEIVFSE